MREPRDPPAFYGGFYDIAVNVPRRVVVVGVEIPFGEYDRFTADARLPSTAGPSEPDEVCPPLLLMPCREPRHPENEIHVMAEAMIGCLVDWLEIDVLVVTPALSTLFDELRARLDGTPIHIMPAANADLPEEA